MKNPSTTGYYYCKECAKRFCDRYGIDFYSGKVKNQGDKITTAMQLITNIDCRLAEISGELSRIRETLKMICSDLINYQTTKLED